MKRFRKSYLFLFLILIGLVFLDPAPGSRPALGAQPAPAKPALSLTDNRATDAKDIVIETGEWRIAFGLLYNGGVYRLYDKVNDPEMKDNLVCGRNYTQGGIFDYDLYLAGRQEFMSTLGPNPDPGRTKLDILENTKARIRLRQFCRPRLNNGGGPPGDRYIELSMVEETTEWTIYPTGRVAITFDAVAVPGWNGVVSQGPGGSGPGISADGYTITAANGVDFLSPWVTAGDTIESKSGGWGPLPIARCRNGSTLILLDKLDSRTIQAPPKGANLDFIIRRPYPFGETISIHADGGTNKNPREQCWLGGSNGVPVFNQGRLGDIRRPNFPLVMEDYVFAHWTVEGRGFGSLLAFNEPHFADFAVINDFDYSDISYTQYIRGLGDGSSFEPVHRHFLAQLGVKNASLTPMIKGIPDALPFADDYLNPYAQARAGTLKTGEGITQFGFHVPTGAYQITAKNKVAAIAFDASRGRKDTAPIAYQTPAVLVYGMDVPDAKLVVELSRDIGKTFRPLAENEYKITSREEAPQLGGKDRRLIQLLVIVPAGATGDRAWVLRLRPK